MKMLRKLFMRMIIKDDVDIVCENDCTNEIVENLSSSGDMVPDDNIDVESVSAVRDAVINYQNMNQPLSIQQIQNCQLFINWQ